jgi:protocatechuate 3,4-dioxygenase beta subunit
MKKQIHNRRDFIRLGIAGAAAGLAVPYLSLGKEFLTAGCAPTTPDIIGPYYLANAPSNIQLSSPTEPGTLMVISGTVRSENCPVAIPNALIEVWHATDAGTYYANVNPFTLRGSLYSATNGEYSFNSIQPGWYLNGAQYRPKHVHYKVSAPGYSTLITQLYFVGDPYIPTDPWASQPAAALRIIPLVNNNGTLEGQFDIWLDEASTGMNTPYSTKGVLMQNQPNPFSANTNIYFNVFNYSDVQLFITDVQGKTVKNLINQKFVPGRYQAFWDGTTNDGNGVSSGIFLANLMIDNERMKEIKMILQK